MTASPAIRSEFAKKRVKETLRPFQPSTKLSRHDFARDQAERMEDLVFRLEELATSQSSG